MCGGGHVAELLARRLDADLHGDLGRDLDGDDLDLHRKHALHRLDCVMLS